ncbi:MAG: beta-3-deoxy-D-manno-oct-2-ulosonic acid transferase [Sphingomicrobium sp.]
MVDLIRRLRVGGTYWGARPSLPAVYVLSRCSAGRGAVLDLHKDLPVVRWREGRAQPAAGGDVDIRGECDPWHMLFSAAAYITDEVDDVCLVALLLGVPSYLYNGATKCLESIDDDSSALLDQLLPGSFENPFTGQPMTVREAAELCGFWRCLIDSNRGIDGGLGFAFWKQSHVAPLLWNGSRPFRFHRSARDVSGEASVAIWRARTGSDAVAELERRGVGLVEVEDGFLRSRGLGADCIPPLSITVDRLGPHFDPSDPSELEQLLQDEDFDGEILSRARQLRHVIVDSGLGKYEQATIVLERPAGGRRHILVPGQVEDDRSVRAGGCGLVSNLELLKKVRAGTPEAYILYKPHPDVLAGHRRGAISDRLALEHADQIVGELPISSLIAMVDEVHVNTSLAGFEALLRGKAVTTYGVPFYAGWGLTRDFGPVPSRRTAKRSLDELVAATLLLYPRYLDPVTGLPCPAEVVVARLCAADAIEPNFIVGMRRLQGKLARRLRSLVQ